MRDSEKSEADHSVHGHPEKPHSLPRKNRIVLVAITLTVALVSISIVAYLAMTGEVTEDKEEETRCCCMFGCVSATSNSTATFEFPGFQEPLHLQV